MQSWSSELQRRLRAVNGSSPRYTVHYSLATQTDDAALLITREHHGGVSSKHFAAGFFGSPEYQRIAGIGNTFKDLLRPGAHVTRGKTRQDIDSVPEAVDWLMEQAKQGQSIQRYKGLGEMNPSQLWETTVNPETRRLMQVRIEDAVAADEIFSTLMGDHVEPRRDFIERNALTVANLDV
jgi:DNA gyrase subunit B